MSPEKLVRDLIPEIMRKNGEDPQVRTAALEEVDQLLRMKILEEAGELMEYGSVEEIADVLEAADALLEMRGISRSEIMSIREKKCVERGGFSMCYVLTMEDE